MKLCIIVEPPLNSEHFSKLEEIRGHVDLRGTANSLGEAQISVSLQGEILILSGNSLKTALTTLRRKVKVNIYCGSGQLRWNPML